MGGVLLDYPAKTILNKGRAQGRAEGRAEGRTEGALENFTLMVQNLMQSMNITAEKACELLKANVDDYETAKKKLLLSKESEI